MKVLNLPEFRAFQKHIEIYIRIRYKQDKNNDFDILSTTDSHSHIERDGTKDLGQKDPLPESILEV